MFRRNGHIWHAPQMVWLVIIFLLEVKCPFSARECQITPETIRNLQMDDQTGLWTLCPEHEYYYQVQGQLYVTGRTLCYLAIYTFNDFVVVDVPKMLSS